MLSAVQCILFQGRQAVSLPGVSPPAQGMLLQHLLETAQIVQCTVVLNPRNKSIFEDDPKGSTYSDMVTILLQPQEVVVSDDPEVVVKKEPGAGDVIYRWEQHDRL